VSEFSDDQTFEHTQRVGRASGTPCGRARP
jgi:hypothetical protein